ncbi:MAG: radical SAM family heme chaperone HemW [Acidobacteria bacterium]|nr:radical SAM family heme chaperone HemW [Acidobacteriota bacterium]
MTQESDGLPPGATSAPGAYVHVPFCAHRCTYCSFVALEGKREEEDFFEGVEREVRARGGEAAGGLTGFDTVYFGGGTPSYVDARRLGRLLGTFKDVFGLSSDVEITAEANPDDLTPGKISELRVLGVNRLSVGVQSLVDAELVPLERRHDASAARKAVREAVAAFGNVSADLMIGIPGQTRESLRASLDGLLEAGVAHLSVYILEIEKAPRLVALKKAQPEIFADDDEMADRWLEVDERLERAGLPRYELSNWAKRGFESRHNLKYWTLVPVLGFGVAAHSFDGKKRYANTGMLAEYLKRTREGKSPTATSEETEDSDFLRVKEGLMLRLRLAGGVPSSTFKEIRRTLPVASAQRLEDAFLAELLEETSSPPRVRLTRKGVLLSNEVFSALV